MLYQIHTYGVCPSMLKIQRSGSLPCYRQVEAWLRTEIEAGRLLPNTAVPEERELAKRMGLSRMTVRRALVTLTDEGLLYRIRGRGTYVKASAAPAARALDTVGIVAPFGQSELRESFFYYRIMEGLQSATGTHGLALVYRPLAAPFAAFADALVRDSNARALVALGIVDPEVLGALAAQKVPLILVDSSQPPGHPPCDTVTHEGRHSAEQAVRHLLERGHRKIGLLTYGPTPASLARETGYRLALAGRRIELRPEWIVYAECNGAAAYAAARRMLREPDPVTALFCTTDEMAMGAIAAVKDHGWQVPRDLSVIGFGDLGYFCQPALSSVRMPLEEMGRKAAELLRARIDEPAAAPVTASFPSEFVARASTDFPRAD